MRESLSPTVHKSAVPDGFRIQPDPKRIPASRVEPPGDVGESLLAQEPWSKIADARPCLGVAGGPLLTPGTFKALTGANGAETVS